MTKMASMVICGMMLFFRTSDDPVLTMISQLMTRSNLVRHAFKFGVKNC